MRMLIAALTAAVTSLASAQFTVQTPIPTGRNLGGVAFTSPTHGFVVGENHHLLETFDAGATWTQRMGTDFGSDPFYTITFPSPTHGYIGGNNQDAYRTTDGGQTWTQMTTMLAGSTRDLDFVSPTVGFHGLNGAIGYTNNGGITWQLRQGYPDAPIVYGMDFRDELVGLVGGARSTPFHDQGIYRTADGGLSWTLVHAGGVNDLIWLDQTSALAIDGDAIIRTDDEGLTWYPYSFTPIDTGLGSMCRAAQSNTLGGVSGGGDIWLSQDLGLSWVRLVEGIGVLPADWAISFSDELNGWVVGASGLVYRTDNGGLSWTLMNSGCGDEITDLRFFDDNNGIATTHNGYAWITHNGGRQWDVHRLRVTGLQFGRSEGLDAAYMHDADTIWVGGRGGVLFRTDDGGESWNTIGYPIGLPAWLNINTLHFTDENNGWLGSQGQPGLYRTTDGGYSWMPNPNIQGWVNDIEFQGQRGWLIYPSSVILRTTNGGDTWTQSALPNGATQWYSATDIDFADQNTGWVVGWFGSIARTTNGGVTWTPQFRGQNEIYLAVHAVSPSEAWIVGRDNDGFDNIYLRTTNGGQTWTRTVIPDEESFSRIVVRPSGQAWIGGSFGKILHRAAPPLTIALPNNTPAVVPAATPTPVLVRITGGAQQVASASLWYRRTTTGVFTAAPLTHLGADDYQAMLPAFACSDTPQFYFSATGSGGTTSTLPANAPVGFYTTRVGTFQTAPMLETTFGAGLPGGWATTGLWHVTAACAPPGSCGSNGARAYFGQDATCNYQVNGRTAGILRSPTLTLPTLQPGQNITLSFCSALDTEYANNSFGDDDISQLWWATGAYQAPLEWFADHSTLRTYTFNLNDHAGTAGRLEWRFDTMNEYMNSFRGWHIDDIRLLAPALVCVSVCDPDINCDGSADQDDVICLINAVAGNPGCECHDPDFNRDGNVDQEDVAAIINVVAGGACP